MLSLLLTIFLILVIFALIWWVISAIPFPPPIAKFRWVFYVVLVIILIIVLIGFIPGFHWPTN